MSLLLASQLPSKQGRLIRPFRLVESEVEISENNYNKLFHLVKKHLHGGSLSYLQGILPIQHPEMLNQQQQCKAGL